MVDTKRDDASNSPTASGARRSGSDTMSAAQMPSAASIGNAGQPAGGSGMTAGHGSGSDTASAARISAGTSVGTVGQPPRPQGFGQQDQGQGGGANDLRERAGEALDQASEWARDQYEQGSRQLDWARDQSVRQLRQARTGIERFVSENPLMVGVVGLAAGLVIGALLPRTRQEDRAFGQWADQVRDQGLRYAREATQRGRAYVEEALGGADSEDEWQPEDERRGGGVRSSGPRYQNH